MKKSILLLVIIFFPLLLISQIIGKVIKIKDGDTIVVLDNEKKEHTVRIADIDCPEMGQAFGKKAKWFVSDQIYLKTITIVYKDKYDPFDKYGRIIGYAIYGKNKNLSMELLRSGLAWHYKYYSDDKEMGLLEKAAKKRKIGLWKDKEPIAPWKWRRK